MVGKTDLFHIRRAARCNVVVDVVGVVYDNSRATVSLPPPNHYSHLDKANLAVSLAAGESSAEVVPAVRADLGVPVLSLPVACVGQQRAHDETHRKEIQ